MALRLAPTTRRWGSLSPQRAYHAARDGWVLPWSDGSAAVVTDGDYGGIVVTRIDQTGVVASSAHHGPSPLLRVFLLVAAAQAAPMLLSLLVALALSGAMRRHRYDTLCLADQQVRLASLARRTGAKLVDGLVGASAPLVVVAHQASQDAWNETTLLLVAIGWGLLVSLSFAYLEGRWGATPGKRVFRIRVVGDNLRPCGFGRAVVRQLAGVADGLFHSLVGIVVIVLGSRWQRVADRAAHTVVIRLGSPQELAAAD